MKKEKHIESPTGCIHIVDDAAPLVFNNKVVPEYTTLCRHNNYHQSYGSGFWHRWPLTSKPVTCRRCLSLSDDSAYKLKELAVKVSDLAIHFEEHAVKCKHFKLESRENAQIFHSNVQLRFCKHPSRERKTNNICNILFCPLKYEG